MAVARVRERDGLPVVDVIFLESARIYKLSRDHPAFSRALSQLRDAAASGRVVKVALSSLDSDAIEDLFVP